MAKTVRVNLDEPFEISKGLVDHLIFRQPVWSDVMGVGAPYTIHRDKEDKPFLVYDEQAIAHYAEVCLVEPSSHLQVIDKVGLVDTLKVREAIVDFFLAAAAVGGGSTTSRKNSSSTAASSPTP